MYKIIFFVPESHLEKVKAALFEKGAGRYKDYDCCSWETAGIGQFRPLTGSKPFIGKEYQIEKVSELRVEMLCADEIVKDVLVELINIHPYEEPAYEAYQIFKVSDF